MYLLLVMYMNGAVIKITKTEVYTNKKACVARQIVATGPVKAYCLKLEDK